MSDEGIDYALKYAPLVESLQNKNVNWLLDQDGPIIRHFLKLERDILRRYCRALERDFQHLRKEAQPAALHDVNLAGRLVSTEDALRVVIRSAARRRMQLLLWRMVRTRLPEPVGTDQLLLLLNRMQGLQTMLAESTL